MRNVLLLLAVGCNGDAGLKVYNSDPEAAIKKPTDGDSVDEFSVVDFVGVVSDDQTPMPDLYVQWASDIDGILVDGTDPADATGQVTYSTANLSSGNHVITLTAIDEDGARGEATIALTVVDQPDAPEIQIVHPANGESADEGEDFTFKIIVSDIQDPPESLVVVFNSSLDGDFCAPTPDASGTAECTTSLTGGDHTLTFTVTDLDGYATSATWVFPVTPGDQLDDDGDGFTEEQGDCDDTNALSYPGGTEIEDGEDNDCDETVDEGTDAYDDDGDGYSENDGDCDDDSASTGPTASEICNGADDDCDGDVDPEDSSGCDAWYYDYDGDSYGSSSASSKCLCAAEGYYTSRYNTDCYDYNPDASPAQTSYQTTHRGDYSYDYNCDGSEVKYWTTSGECNSWPGCTATVGWTGGVASCGSSGSYLTSCDIDWFSCAESTYTETQKCI
jgi:hypothetical protein